MTKVIGNNIKVGDIFLKGGTDNLYLLCKIYDEDEIVYPYVLVEINGGKDFDAYKDLQTAREELVFLIDNGTFDLFPVDCRELELKVIE